jgi:flagellin FlaB
MGKIYKILKTKDVGSIGIGAMIVFIAMVLVAGIAASVLIQTSTTLETQALSTGRETTAEVASGIAVFDILGYTTSSTADISKVAIGIRPRAGSSEIDIAQIFVELSDSATKVLLNYSQTYYKEPDGQDDIFGSSAAFPDYSGAAGDAYQFGVLVIEDADNSLAAATPVMNRGDKVYLCVNTTGTHSDIAERTDMWGIVVPEEGVMVGKGEKARRYKRIKREKERKSRWRKEW